MGGCEYGKEDEANVCHLGMCLLNMQGWLGAGVENTRERLPEIREA
jgi:hypothetical protein